MKKIYTLLFLFLPLSFKGQANSSIKDFINKWIGKPYQYGGKTERGIDCSAFVQRLYKDVYNLIIPRTCIEQIKTTISIGIQQLQIGDLLYFRSQVSPSGLHTGVYIGNDEFIHASNYREGVKISCLEDYSKLLKKIGRISKN